MKTSSNGHTDIGRRRSRNEDSLFLDDDLGLYIVADGMGGHAGGDIASSIAVQTVAKLVHLHRDELTEVRAGRVGEARLTAILDAAVTEAGRAIYRTACASTELSKMGCTLTALLIGDTTAVMAHVGDSRLYLERNGWVRQLSVDHNAEQEFKSRGIVGLAQRRFTRALNSCLTRALGVRPDVLIDHLVIDLDPGDRFVLCSDGFSTYLDNQQQLSVLLDVNDDLEETARLLTDFANLRGGRDNITALVVKVADELNERQLYQRALYTTERIQYPSYSTAC